MTLVSWERSTASCPKSSWKESERDGTVSTGGEATTAFSTGAAGAGARAGARAGAASLAAVAFLEADFLVLLTFGIL
ncbi:MAG: hypothetical protein ACXADW_04155 [Candidatus Hodarchaeales archaeon]